jgi:hypothetical protein
MTDALLEMSQDIGELAKALPGAQGAIAKITRDAANPHFNSRYASLTEIADAVLAAMNNAGFTVLQPARFAGANVVDVETWLLHASAQWLRATHSVPVSRVDAQGVGSALTYARRQALQSFFVVAPQGEDDDGEGAVGRGPGRPPLPPEEPKRPSREVRVERLETTLGQVKTIRDLDRAWALGGDLRSECATEAPELAARLDDLYQRRRVEMVGDAG